MIFKTPGSFPIYIVKVSPGADGEPYAGCVEVGFDFEPTAEDVKAEIEAQLRAGALGALPKKDKFHSLCLKTLLDLWPRSRKPLFPEHVSRVAFHDDQKLGMNLKGPFRNLSIERRHIVSRKGETH